ncbi:putative lipoprotein [Burkholderia cenocepacia BC7]|nr:putative lipoprotein [Burkholderia cenocepacia K56-2Valvano]ERI32135.1 putative lipoprotein [Burkholderia cenocepacia BC7]
MARLSSGLFLSSAGCSVPDVVDVGMWQHRGGFYTLTVYSSNGGSLE